MSIDELLANYNGAEPPSPPRPAKPYQPKTGQRCSCKPGIHRDNCPACEGTGWVIDFAAIRNRTKTP